MRKNLVAGVLVIACVVGIVLVGCEDDDSTNSEASVTTEELTGGAIKTTVRESVALLDGTTAAQISITVTHPDGTSENSVSINDDSLSAEPDGIYSRYSSWRSIADVSPEDLTNAFLLRTTEFTDTADAFQNDQTSDDHARNATNDAPDGRWVVISEGVSNSLEISTDP